MARKYGFVTVDVFTDRAFAGNPLAVFPDARGMSTRQMQRLAREFNYSESTFVLPPRRRKHTAQVRIFTPRDEIPFAGHPNVGTAFVLARGEKTLTFEEKAGLVPVDILRSKGRVVGAMLTAPRPLQIGEEVSAGAIAKCIGGEVLTARHKPLMASVGLPFAIAEVSREALANAQPNLEAFRAASQGHATRTGRFSLFVYARETETKLRARMFAPLSGIQEDPATGSANCALVGLLAHLAPEKDLTLKLDVRQGVEMGRPSRLMDVAEKKNGVVTRIRVGGKCAVVLEGSGESRRRTIAP